MTPEKKSRLPQEAESYAKREELSAVFTRLEDLCKDSTKLGSKWSRPVFVQESGEVFEMSFVRKAVLDRFAVSGRERILEIEALRTYQAEIWGSVRGGELRKESEVLDFISYHPDIIFVVIKENPNGQFTGANKEQLDTPNDLGAAIEIAAFFEQKLNSHRATDRKKALVEIPKSLVDLIERLRESEALQYEYARRDFGKSMSKLEDKLEPVEADDSEYERTGFRTKATTGWVRVQKDGIGFDLKFSKAGYSSNGGWEETDVIDRREVGEVGDGRYLFSSQDISRGDVFSEIKTAKEVRECIEILELLNV